MIIVPFDPAHLRGFVPQPAQAEDFAWQPAAPAAELGEAYTVIQEGRAICCAGIMPIWPGRAYSWALLAADAGPYMLGLTREVRRVVGASPHARIEMYVDPGHKASIRWACMLGFEFECQARKYLPRGRDAYLFARIK